MDNINVPNYSSLTLTDSRIKAIQYLYDYINKWKGEEDSDSNSQNNLSAIMALAMNPSSGITIDTSNSDYKIAWVDSQSNVLIGKKQDNSWYYAGSLDDILDTIISNL